jgi:hypothetical protein
MFQFSAVRGIGIFLWSFSQKVKQKAYAYFSVIPSFLETLSFLFSEKEVPMYCTIVYHKKRKFWLYYVFVLENLYNILLPEQYFVLQQPIRTGLYLKPQVYS